MQEDNIDSGDDDRRRTENKKFFDTFLCTCHANKAVQKCVTLYFKLSTSANKALTYMQQQMIFMFSTNFIYECISLTSVIINLVGVIISNLS